MYLVYTLLCLCVCVWQPENKVATKFDRQTANNVCIQCSFLFASKGLPTDMACILKSTQMTILNDIEREKIGIGCGIIFFPFETARFGPAMWTTFWHLYIIDKYWIYIYIYILKWAKETFTLAKKISRALNKSQKHKTSHTIHMSIYTDTIYIYYFQKSWCDPCISLWLRSIFVTGRYGNAANVFRLLTTIPPHRILAG